MDSPRRRVAAPPRPRRGRAADTNRLPGRGRPRPRARARRYNALKPSVGIFGDAGALDWGGGARSGGGAQAGTRDGLQARAQKNGISNDAQMRRAARRPSAPGLRSFAEVSLGCSGATPSSDAANTLKAP